jgi:hypothetical protein
MAGKKKVSLVVTADDFALSDGVDKGILTAFREGIVRNTALLTNYPDLDTSVARIRDAKGLDVGIHLNLTSGVPILSAKQVPSLVGRKGNFHTLRGFLSRAASGAINWAEVEWECGVQIERGLQLGCVFSSISSHQHVHMMPMLMRITANLSKRYGIPVVRLSHYPLRSMLSSPGFKMLALSGCALVGNRILNREGIAHNDYILELPGAGQHMASYELAKILDGLGDTLCELVCHPGYIDAGLEARDPYTVGRHIELEILTSREMCNVLRERFVAVTTFAAVMGERKTLKEEQKTRCCNPSSEGKWSVAEPRKE